MKEILKQIKYAKQIVAKVLNTLNDDQESSFQQFDEIDVDKKVIRDILNYNKFEDWNNQMDQLDTSKAWTSFVTRMQDPNKKGKVIKMRIIKAISSVAAILILALSINFAYRSFIENSHYQTISESNISPGTPHAQLILANGEEVNLEASKEDVIKEGSISIANSKGVLKYNSSNKKEILMPVVNTLKIPRGGEYQLVLPDGTKAWLNSDSELTYTVPFSENERRVKLKGEAYFDVAHNKDKPFIVETINQSIEVLGTEFNISAYPEDLNIVTTLVEGKVKVAHLNEIQKGLEEFLIPNEQLILDKETSVTFKQEVDTYIYTSWKDGRFKFVNEPIESFLIKLARWYDVDIFITDESIKEIRFSGDLPRYKNMSSILKIVEAEMSVHIEIEDNKIIYISK